MADTKTSKKFFDRFRGGSSSGQKSEHETKELLSAENFTAANVKKIKTQHC